MKLILIALTGVGLSAIYLLNKKTEPVAQTENENKAIGNISDGAASTGNGFFDDMVMNVTKVLEPRGIRNNNPGNLVLTTIAWKGKVPNAQNTDKHFEQFTAPLWGIRAMFMDVRGDIEKDGLNTLRKLIAVYAPAHENNTQAYIDFVSKKLGIGADSKIMPSHYFELLKAIIQIENGKQPYTDALIIEAMNTK
jgi:hypothetical protein